MINQFLRTSALAILLCAGSAFAAADSFMLFEQPSDSSTVIKGESMDTKAKGYVQYESLSFGVENTVKAQTGSPVTAGKGKTKPVVFQLKACEATLQLFIASAMNISYGKVTIFHRKAGDKDWNSTMELSQVTVTSVEYAGAGEVPDVKVTLAYQGITLNYTPSDTASGALQTSKKETVTWSSTGQ
jgi:type VI protein secretion system component Hcp